MNSPLVDDFLSKDVSRILRATWTVIKTRDPVVLAPLARALPRIDRATDDLDYGGMLASNASHVTHAMDRIRLFGTSTCLCVAYRDHQFYEPAKEAAAGHIRIVDEIPVFFEGRTDRPKRVCECTDCGLRYEVEEGEYHYTWWKWTPRGR